MKCTAVKFGVKYYNQNEDFQTFGTIMKMIAKCLLTWTMPSPSHSPKVPPTLRKQNSNFQISISMQYRIQTTITSDMKTPREGFTKSVVVTATVGLNFILILISSLLFKSIEDTSLLLVSVVLQGRRQSEVW